MRARVAVLVLVVAGLGCGDSGSHELCDPCECDNGCGLRVCYRTSDGQPVTYDYRGARWVAVWLVTPEKPLFAGGGVSSVCRGMYDGGSPGTGELCVEMLVCAKPDPSRTAAVVWAKFGGFKPAVTFPVHCGKDATQVLEPTTAEEEAAQVCGEIPLDGGCYAEGDVTTMDGGSLQGWTDIWSTADVAPGTCTDRSWDAVQGTRSIPGHFFVDPGTTLMYQEGYLPHLECMPCGDYKVSLEKSPYLFRAPGACATSGASGNRAMGALFAVVLVACAGRLAAPLCRVRRWCHHRFEPTEGRRRPRPTRSCTPAAYGELASRRRPPMTPGRTG